MGSSSFPPADPASWSLPRRVPNLEVGNQRNQRNRCATAIALDFDGNHIQSRNTPLRLLGNTVEIDWKEYFIDNPGMIVGILAVMAEESG